VTYPHEIKVDEGAVFVKDDEGRIAFCGESVRKRRGGGGTQGEGAEESSHG
jgi:hypothetical protein